MKNDQSSNTSAKNFGLYLKSLREGKRLSLRGVEEATSKDVSNAYLSQLENGKIAKPSPHILHALSIAYSEDYTRLMERAGYLSPTPATSTSKKHGRAATFSIDNLSPDEESELLEYLTFIRNKRKDNS